MKPCDRILKAYYDSQERHLYFNQLKRKSGLSDSSLARGLNALASEGILSKEVTTALTFYDLSDVSKIALTFSKFDLDRLKPLQRDVRVPIEAFIKRVRNVPITSVIFFGSASRNDTDTMSDIDLLVIFSSFRDSQFQARYEASIRKTFAQIQREIGSYSIYPFSLFFTNTEDFQKNEDHVIKQARDTGYPIVSQQQYHELVLNES